MIGDPEHDVEIAMDAEDSLSPSAVAGVLVAPPDTHLELAASVGWEATAHVAGDVGAVGAGTGARAQIASPEAKLDLAEPVTVRTGVRWLADRWIAEANADLWIFPDAARDRDLEPHRRDDRRRERRRRRPVVAAVADLASARTVRCAERSTSS